jgi:hypothetical protein
VRRNVLISSTLLDGLHLLDNVKTLDDLSEDDVLAVQPEIERAVERTGQVSCSHRLSHERMVEETDQEVTTVQMKNWLWHEG